MACKRERSGFGRSWSCAHIGQRTRSLPSQWQFFEELFSERRLQRGKPLCQRAVVPSNFHGFVEECTFVPVRACCLCYLCLSFVICFRFEGWLAVDTIQVHMQFEVEATLRVATESCNIMMRDLFSLLDHHVRSCVVRLPCFKLRDRKKSSDRLRIVFGVTHRSTVGPRPPTPLPEKASSCISISLGSLAFPP